jgi:hypothetical protein
VRSGFRVLQNIDGLEVSIIYIALFVADFLGIILKFQTGQNAPFRASFLGMITYELIWNKLKLTIKKRS